MKSRFTALTVVALSWLLLCNISCKKNPIAPSTEQLNPISNLKAFSVSSSSVGLVWTRSPSASSSDFGDYVVTARAPAGAVVDSFSIGVDTSAIANLLTEGVFYSFSVIARSAPTSSSMNSTAVSIVWAAAKRFETVGGLPIRIYESSSSAGNSAFIVYSKSSQTPRTVNLFNPVPPSDSAEVDLYVRTENSTSVSIRSANLYRTSQMLMRFPRMTIFSSSSRSAADLNDPEVAPPDTNTYLLFNTIIWVDTTSVLLPRIYYFKGNDGNYGRLLVKCNPSDGTMLWGNSPDRYIVVALSYQSVAFNRIAKRQ
jgi:hypothetical protein